jgi:Undecaprenyl-phosphate galactose phosphotransferase WbaP
MARPVPSSIITVRQGQKKRLAMQTSIHGDRIASSAGVLVGRAARTRVLPKRWAETWRRRLVNPTLIISDIVLALVVWEAVFVLQGIFWGQSRLTEVAVATSVSNVAVWIGLRGLLGLYPGYGLDQTEELRRQTHAVLATLAMTMVFAVAFHIGDLLSRLLLVFGFLGLSVVAPLVRHFIKRTMEAAGVWGKPVVILSSGDTGERLSRTLQREWSLGLKPIAVFESDAALLARELSEEALPGGVLADTVRFAEKCRVDTIILNVPSTRPEQLVALGDWASVSFRHVVILSADLVGVMSSAAVARNFAGNFGGEIRYNLLDPWTRRVKRALDLFGVVVGGLLISLLLLALIVLVKLDSPGPAFYGSLRRGAGGRQFRCWKFRTMRADAEKMLEEYLHNNPDLKAEWELNYKLQDDPRVTRMGTFLRKTSLDELPQLWNVLTGEMSLVGPRPMLEEEMPNYGKTYELYKRVRPGITGFWQVSGRSDIGYEERLTMNAYYVRNWSVWLDLVILARTVRCVVLGRGAR